MALSDLNQSERAEFGHVRPLILVDVEMSGLTLRWSTQDFVYQYGSPVTRLRYESYLLEFEGLGQISNFGKVDNPSVTLTLANQPYGSYVNLSRLNDDVEFQRATVSFWECLLSGDDEEVFASSTSGRTLKWKGSIERLHSIDTRKGTFKITCCSRIHAQRNRLGLKRVKTSAFPYADKAAVGQYRSIPIGDIDMLPCKLLKTGAMDTLFMATGKGTGLSTIVVSGITKVPWVTTGGTIQIKEEQFTYTSYNPSTKTFSGITRAVNGTIATRHETGEQVFQVLTEFIYECSSIAVDDITEVLVDNVRQPFGTGESCKVYTGRSGSELTGYKAAVRFTVKPNVTKQVNVEVDSEHAHATAQGSHSHTYGAVTDVTRTGIGTGLITGYVTNPDHVRDGDNDTEAYMASSYSHLGEAFFRLYLNNSTDQGPITAITVRVNFDASTHGTGTVARITYGGYTVAEYTNGGNVGRGTRSYSISPAAGWGGYLDFYCAGGGYDKSANMSIGEARVIITCSPIVGSSPASGVSTATSGATALGGDSTAEVVIGKEVVVAITGPRDATVCTGLSAGAITGTSGRLIERPDHVIKFLLCARMGNSLDDIGDSFDVAGDYYEANGYALAFLLHDISSDAMDLIKELASQCHSLFWEWGGKFELKVLPNFDPGTFDFTIESDEIISGPVYSYQTLADTSNLMGVLYRKDYRSQREDGTTTQSTIRSEARDAGYLEYLEDGWGPRDIEETIRLTAVRKTSMAQSYLDWKKLKKELPEKTVSMTCPWRETKVTPGMVFFYSDAVEGDGSYVVTNYRRDERNKQIQIDGVLLPSWKADDLVSETVLDELPGIIQTHILMASDIYSESQIDTIGALCVPSIHSIVSESILENPSIEQTHVLSASSLTSETVIEVAALGQGWELDEIQNLQPSDYYGEIGWWEDDSTEMMPRSSESGSDAFWEEDESGDLMPVAA